MIKVYLLLIALCVAQCAFLEDYSETSCGDFNVKCSMVPFVKSCEKYDYCLSDGWYYDVKCHQCKKIHIEDGYYPTDNFYKTKQECDCACNEANTISYDRNLDPTYECKKAPDFYKQDYSDDKWSGTLWTYQAKSGKCISFEWPGYNYQPSYNVYHNKQECEDFCINYLYDHDHYGNDDYKGNDYTTDDYKTQTTDNYNNYDDSSNKQDYDDNMKHDDYNKENDDDYDDNMNHDDNYDKQDDYNYDDNMQHDDSNYNDNKKDDYSGSYDTSSMQTTTDYNKDDDDYQQTDDNYGIDDQKYGQSKMSAPAKNATKQAVSESVGQSKKSAQVKTAPTKAAPAKTKVAPIKGSQPTMQASA